MVYQQPRRWLAAGCFEAIIHDLHAVLRFAEGRDPEPTAAILDGRTIQSTPESGGRAGVRADVWGFSAGSFGGAGARHEPGLLPTHFGLQQGKELLDPLRIR